jgi:ATP-dependent helicase/nuclease subunit A
MIDTHRQSLPPDLDQRNRALDPARSVLVRAPAGSGKTDLLTRRFLRLLAEVDDPAEIVAITFTKAAAAEMRHRILAELEKASLRESAEPDSDFSSMEALAARALARSRARGWNLVDLPAQLRISTIDSFCRELALQRPLLSGLGGALEIQEHPTQLYRRAARRALMAIDGHDAELREAIRALLLWRGNNWQEMEDLLISMLQARDRWMHDFVLGGNPDWDALRVRLERPFARTSGGDSPPICYTGAEWPIVRACFILLRRAAAELLVVFAEAGVADFTEVAQTALRMLRGEDNLPTDAAIALADGIRHLLVDEFQDTSRRQHQLLNHLIAAWPGREGRTCFVVGDSMQSIYFFRDADAELFSRVENLGLEIPNDLPLKLDPVALAANFRSAPALVAELNQLFAKVFEEDDGSGVRFTAAEPAREESEAELLPGGGATPRMELHLEFIPDRSRSGSAVEMEKIREECTAARDRQIEEIVALIRSYNDVIEQTRAGNLRAGGESEKKKYRVAVLGRARKALAPIAAVLKEENIPFRAVDLEPLNGRPEILDALALARALLSPQDRLAWLGVLRAPWCGLSLEDLHRLTSADDQALRVRPVPDLLTERLQRVSGEGRNVVERVLTALEASARFRATQPSASLGTWLQQVWLALGGAHCVDAKGRANLDLLWLTLDALPEGEQDLLGPALDVALEKLTALPDPAADEDCGVQLMTIHKAKGLEFEIVIVPELQATNRKNETRLLSWLERGLTESEDADEPIEFLVAPIAAKGADRGSAKERVDRVIREREHQEMRRLLYVAASRAREQLHLFARPVYKTEKSGSLTLASPRESLLSTAWPALEPEIQRRFSVWRGQAAADVAAIAAAAEPEPQPPCGSHLRRLPPDAIKAPLAAAWPAEPAIAGLGSLYERHEGGLRSRTLGIAVHALLEEIARLRAAAEWDAVRAALPRFASRIAAQIRSTGIDRREAARMASQAVEVALRATHDPAGAWILSPRPGAQSEARWAGFVSGGPRTVQVDRVFRAGAEPQSEGDSVWWIVDYKTAHEEGSTPHAALPKLRKEFAPQLAAYAQVLRQMHGSGAQLRAGLYYPRMPAFDWWEIQ